jgi:septation ring formation regulator EzrA
MIMATVRSLEERIDEMSEDVTSISVRMDTVSSQIATMSAQLASIMSALGTTTAQLAVVTARFDGLATELNRVNTRSETAIERIEKLALDFTVFRAMTETIHAFARRTFIIFIGIVITVVGSLFWIAKEAGRYEGRYEQQQKLLQEIKLDLNDIKSKQKL